VIEVEAGIMLCRDTGTLKIQDERSLAAEALTTSVASHAVSRTRLATLAVKEGANRTHTTQFRSVYPSLSIFALIATPEFGAGFAAKSALLALLVSVERTIRAGYTSGTRRI